MPPAVVDGPGLEWNFRRLRMGFYFRHTSFMSPAAEGDLRLVWPLVPTICFPIDRIECIPEEPSPRQRLFWARPETSRAANGWRR